LGFGGGGAVVVVGGADGSAATAIGDAPVVAPPEYVCPQAEQSNSTQTANKSRGIVVSFLFLNPCQPCVYGCADGRRACSESHNPQQAYLRNRPQCRKHRAICRL